MSTTGSLVRLIIFAIITSILTFFLATTIGNLDFQERTTYRAVFADVSGVIAGDDVRIAGVAVGQVQEVDVVEAGADQGATLAEVTFNVDEEVPLTEGTQAAIRFRNIVGQRYVSLAEGPGGGARLEEDALIPLQQTETALDLSVLFAGFQPLFEALSPEEVNAFSQEIIAVFQGEGATFESLLQRTALLTNALADREALFDEVFTNFTRTLEYVGDRDDELSNLIDSLQEFTSGFADDSEAIFSTLAGVDQLALTTEDLLADIREPLRADLVELRRVATIIDDDEAFVDDLLQRLPAKVNKINRTAHYGSFFNFYLCQFDATVVTPGGDIDIPGVRGDEARCTP